MQYKATIAREAPQVYGQVRYEDLPLFDTQEQAHQELKKALEARFPGQWEKYFGNDSQYTPKGKAELWSTNTMGHVYPVYTREEALVIEIRDTILHLASLQMQLDEIRGTK